MADDAAPVVGDSPDWERLYAELQQEQGELLDEIMLLRTERDIYHKVITALLAGEALPVSREELFGLIEKQPPLQELIAQLEREVGHG